MTETDARPPEGSVTLDIEVTLPDIEEWNLLVAFSPRMRARWRRQFAVMYGLAAVILPTWNLYTIGFEAFDPVSDALVPLLLLAAIAAVVTPLSYAAHRWNVRRLVRTMLGRAPREDYLGPKRIEVSGTGIAVTGANSTTRYGWQAVTGLAETERLILVMLGETVAILVPKRGQDEAKLAALRAAVGARSC